MSDEEVQTKPAAKRGRKPNPEKAIAKKQEEKNNKNVDNDEGDAPPVKRGRGRPKGSGKKTASKTNGTTGTKSRRGRPKREEKKEESSAEEDNEKSSGSGEDDDDDEEDDD